MAFNWDWTGQGGILDQLGIFQPPATQPFTMGNDMDWAWGLSDDITGGLKNQIGNGQLDMGGINNLLGSAANIGGLWSLFDQQNQMKDAFKFQKNMAKENMKASKDALNQDVWRKYESMYRNQGGENSGYMSPEDYRKQNTV